MQSSLDWPTLLLVLAIPCSCTASGLRTVTLTDTRAPGTASSARFSQLGTPTLNDAGKVAFSAQLSRATSQTNSGIWSEDFNGLKLIVRKGDLSGPSAGHPPFANFYLAPHLTSHGEVSFGASLSSTSSTSDTGIWANDGTTVKYVAGEGGVVPGVPTERFYWTNAGLIGNHLMSDSGRIAILSGAYPFGMLDPARVRVGIWAGKSDDFQLVALKGNPGPAELASFDYLTFDSLATSPDGIVAFSARLRNAAGQTTDAIFSDADGVPHVEVKHGDHVFDLPSTTQITYPGYPSIQGQKSIAFLGGLEDTLTGELHGALLHRKDDENHLVYRIGDPLEGLVGDEILTNFGFPSINRHDDIAFWGLITGSDAYNATGVWLKSDGVLKMVGREGQAAPGAETGFEFLDIEQPVLNDLGQIAFEASLAASPSSAASVRGIWATSPNGRLKKIASTGDTLEVALGDLRTITNVAFLENSDIGLPTGFNNSGQIAFYAYFTDFSAGIFVTDLAVPEPSSGFASLVLVLAGNMGRLTRIHCRR